MTKQLGFLKDKRMDPGYRPAEIRLRDFEPVERVMSRKEVQKQVGRCMECGTPFCHGYGCPLANVIPECNELVYQDRWQEALELLLTTNPFPEFTGRICPALCEASCVAALNGDAVAIRQMELAVIENGFESGYMAARPQPVRRAGRVAVVGSGPAGLTVAEVLNQAGCQVTIFDEAAHAGGVLRYGIPNFKLDKAVVQRRIELMQKEGVTFEMKVRVGDDVSYRYLTERFDAICLCGGAREPRRLQVPGAELEGIYCAMDFLTCQNKLEAGESVLSEQVISAAGKTVAVIGGGDTGSDCLGTALRQGAKQVLQFEIMPKAPQQRPEHNPWPQWPRINRESSSHKEGGVRRWCVSTQEFVGRDGKVVGLKGVEVDWQLRDGRMVPVNREGTDYEVQADMVLLALGFVGPGRNTLADAQRLEKDARGNICVNEKHQASQENIFASGDMVSGQSLVVHAIADGMQTAASILAYLKQKGV